MNVLEKILKEVGLTGGIQFSRYTEPLIAVKDVERIIRSHMDEMPKCNNCSRREWYQVGYRDDRRINVENIKSINKEMSDYLAIKYCVYGFDEELDKIFNKYLVLGRDADVSINYKSIEEDEIEPVSEEFLKDCAETAKKYRRENDGWIPVEDTEHTPKDESYVLVSFSNFSLPDIARYEENEEGGTYYPGDDEDSYLKYGLFVNAWMPIPKPYRHEDI